MPSPDFDLGKYPVENARMTPEHEYFIPSIDNPLEGLVGITDYAAHELGDVVYVQLPEVGTQLRQLVKMGEIESVKTVSDLFSPVDGEVLETNGDLLQKPESINGASLREGWMLRVRITDPSQLDNLMTPESYANHLDGVQEELH